MSAVGATTVAVVSSREDLRSALAGVDGVGSGPVALVPTMGALHAGHLSLVHEAREVVGPEGAVVVSIFVNPTQFGPGEDLDAYPRTPQEDLRACAEAGVDLVWAPGAGDVYPGTDAGVTVHPGPAGDVLEGASRPTHFRGVLTVVAKLLGAVRPDVVVLGEKDYQQLVLLRGMVADLDLGVAVHGVATVREDDGLALSSRNRYLDPDQRAVAAAVPRALEAARASVAGGSTSVLDAVARALDVPGLAIDYVELRTPDLRDQARHGPARLLLAVRVGGTRLIDNTALVLPDSEDHGPS